MSQAGVSPASLAEGTVPYYEGERGHALQILVLSGGGQKGGFGAGFLKGWRERGGRPQFDVVTGVSAGALLATHRYRPSQQTGSSSCAGGSAQDPTPHWRKAQPGQAGASRATAQLHREPHPK